MRWCQKKSAEVKPGLTCLLGWRQKAFSFSGRFSRLDFPLQTTNVETWGISEHAGVRVVCTPLEKRLSTDLCATYLSLHLPVVARCMFTASFLTATRAASTALCRGSSNVHYIKKGCALTSCSHLMFHFKQKLLFICQLHMFFKMICL